MPSLSADAPSGEGSEALTKLKFELFDKEATALRPSRRR